MTLFLVAYVTNAQSHETAEVELEVASKSLGDTWITSSGTQVLPFWSQPIEIEIPPIPEGWLEYLHEEAMKYASTRSTPKVSLAEALGLDMQRQSAPIRRRV